MTKILLIVMMMINLPDALAQRGRGSSGGGGTRSGGGMSGGGFNGGGMNRGGGSTSGGSRNTGGMNRGGTNRSGINRGGNSSNSGSISDNRGNSEVKRNFNRGSTGVSRSDWSRSTLGQGNQSVPRTRTDYVNRRGASRTRNYETVNTGSRTRTRYHEAYQYHRTVVYRYQPVYYYAPHYYGYCYSRLYNPWIYSWGWYASPYDYAWYSYFGYYYQPWGTYYYPSYWMTDYIIAEMLAYRYQQFRIAETMVQWDQQKLREENRTIDEATKQQVAEQVNQELAAREKASLMSLDEKLNDPNHIYVLSQSIDVLPEGETGSCGLHMGDLLKLAGAKPNENEVTARMTVVTSQAGSCKAGSIVLVPLQVLQESENNFSALVDEAAEEMQKDSELKKDLPKKSKKKTKVSSVADDRYDDTDDMYPKRRDSR